MKLVRWIHTSYGLLVFAVLFIVFFPPLTVPILFPSKFRWIGMVNRWWAKSLFFLTLLPFRVEYRSPLDPDRSYVFCPNHFSFLDIPTMGLNSFNAIFVGKSEMEKVPLFGFMYGRLHITVDRSSLKSKFNTLMRSREAIDEGKSLVYFPEGGIVSSHPPVMARFKNGAFRIAIEKQIPIVPVSIPNNWIILPDARRLILHRGQITLIFHEPIETKGLTANDLEGLKEKVYQIIASEL